MTGLLLGLVVGGAAGTAVTLWITKRRTHEASSVSAGVSDEERDHLEVNFASHVNHMRDQVSSFADQLAGDDVLLRERLRRFERGEQP